MSPEYAKKTNDTEPESPPQPQKPEPTTGDTVGSWFIIGINALGVALALLPSHWTVAGIIITGFGTIFFSGLYRTDIYISASTDSPWRVHGQREAIASIAYSLIAIGASAIAATLPPHPIGPAVTFSIMSLVPFVLGIRRMFALHGRYLFRAIGSRWSHRVAVTITALILSFYVFTAVAAATNSWVAPTSFVISIILIFPFLINATKMSEPKSPWAGGVLTVSSILLIITGFLGGQPAWLTVTGKPPQQCDIFGAEYMETRTNTTPVYQVQCGSQQFEYDPLLTETVAIENGTLTLVTDSTGVTGPLRPDEVPGILGTIYLINIAIVVGSLLLTLLHPSRKGRSAPRT